MSGLIQYAGVGILLALLGFLLREIGFRGAPIFGVMAIATLYIVVITRVEAILAGLSDIASPLGLSELFSVATRIIGIGYITGLSTDMCKEIGNTGIANTLEMLGRVEILALSLPYLIKMVELVAKDLI